MPKEKDDYVTPDMQVTEFEDRDIITTSNYEDDDPIETPTIPVRPNQKSIW